MSRHTITEASKLSGKSRKTIYRKIEKGELSTVKGEGTDDTTYIDTSELVRVFGSLKVDDAPQPAPTAPVIDDDMLEELERMREENARLKAVLNEKDRRIDDMKDNVKNMQLLLEHQKTLTPQPKESGFSAVMHAIAGRIRQ